MILSRMDCFVSGFSFSRDEYISLQVNFVIYWREYRDRYKRILPDDC